MDGTGMAQSEIGLFEAMYSARAMRWLKPDPVPDQLIARILQSATQAPNAGNAQTQPAPASIPAVQNIVLACRALGLGIQPEGSTASDSRIPRICSRLRAFSTLSDSSLDPPTNLMRSAAVSKPSTCLRASTSACYCLEPVWRAARPRRPLPSTIPTVQVHNLCRTSVTGSPRKIFQESSKRLPCRTGILLTAARIFASSTSTLTNLV